MSYILRKFHRPKWDPDNVVPASVADLSADAITSCLRTSGNTLSVWNVGTLDWGDFDDVLAALFSSFDGPSRTDLIILDASVVGSIDGISLAETRGETPAVEDINAKHRDIVELTQSSLSEFAGIILKELSCNRDEDRNNIKRYSEKNVISIVRQYVDAGMIDTDKLSKRWKLKLGVGF